MMNKTHSPENEMNRYLPWLLFVHCNILISHGFAMLLVFSISIELDVFEKLLEFSMLIYPLAKKRKKQSISNCRRRYLAKKKETNQSHESIPVDVGNFETIFILSARSDMAAACGTI